MCDARFLYSRLRVINHHYELEGYVSLGEGRIPRSFCRYRKTGMLIIAPGETTKTIMVSVKGDKTKEADEAFFVNLSGATNAQIADGRGQGTILNDDGLSTGGKKALLPPLSMRRSSS